MPRSEPITFSGTPAVRAGRVDRHVGGVPQRADALGADALRGEALAPDRRRPARRARRRDALGARVGLARPTAGSSPARGRGRRAARLPMSPFGSRTSAGMPASNASSSSTIAEPRLAGAGHADDDAVRRQVARTDHDRSGAGLAGLRSIADPEVQRPPAASLARSRRGRRPSSRPRDRTAAGGAGDRPRHRRARRARRPRARRSRRGRSGSGARDRLAKLQHRLYAEAGAASWSSSRGSTRRARTASSAACSAGSTRRAVRVTSFKAPDGHRARARLPLAGARRAPRARRDRDLQPLALRGRRRRAHARARAGGGAGAAAPGHIREFERMLVDEGTTILKVFLNVSREEQRMRLQERIDDPEKRWKFRPRRPQGARALRRVSWPPGTRRLTETSTAWAPWYVVPADRNWVKALATAELLVDASSGSTRSSPSPSRASRGCRSSESAPQPGSSDAYGWSSPRRSR